MLGDLSRGFSGSDISLVIQEALMIPLRKILKATHFKVGRPLTVSCTRYKPYLGSSRGQSLKVHTVLAHGFGCCRNDISRYLNQEAPGAAATNDRLYTSNADRLHKCGYGGVETI